MKNALPLTMLAMLSACAHGQGSKSEAQAALLCARLAVDAQLSAENAAVSESTFVAACVDAVAPRIERCVELPRGSEAAQKCLDRRAGTIMNELYKSTVGKLEGTLLGNALELEQRLPAERAARCKDATGELAESCAIANRAVGRPHFEAAGELKLLGPLDGTMVRRALEGRVVELRPCARLHPGVHGRLTLQLTINRYGSVLDTLVRDSTVADPKVQRCVTSTVKRWTFDKPAEDGVEVVTWSVVTRP